MPALKLSENSGSPTDSVAKRAHLSRIAWRSLLLMSPMASSPFRSGDRGAEREAPDPRGAREGVGREVEDRVVVELGRNSELRRDAGVELDRQRPLPLDRRPALREIHREDRRDADRL